MVTAKCRVADLRKGVQAGTFEILNASRPCSTQEPVIGKLHKNMYLFSLSLLMLAAFQGIGSKKVQPRPNKCQQIAKDKQLKSIIHEMHSKEQDLASDGPLYSALLSRQKSVTLLCI